MPRRPQQLTGNPTEHPDAAAHPDVLYERALRGMPVHLQSIDGRRMQLRTDRWMGPAQGADLLLLDRVEEPCLDVGCGPGRLVAALARHEVRSLGIDVSPTAVNMARHAGAPAWLGSIFDPVPAEGRWRTVLLADGNIGIGGDPLRLLRRLHDLLHPAGRLLVEVDGPGCGLRRTELRLRDFQNVGAWFGWAIVGVDVMAGLAAQASFKLTDRWSCLQDEADHASRRWFVELSRSIA